MPGPVAASYRMVTAAFVLAIPFYLNRRKIPSLTSPNSWALPLGAGVIFAINLGLLNSALLLTSAATATLLDNMAPVWVGIGATLLFRERLHVRYWAGLAVALGGAAVVTGANPAALSRMNPGDLIALVGGVFYAGYLLAYPALAARLRCPHTPVAGRRLRRSYPDRRQPAPGFPPDRL